MQAFVHDAQVRMSEGSDVRALGGAVTLELCGSWDHPPPCPVAPHHTAATRDGDDVQVRVLFVTDAGAEDDVRARIDRALASGRVEGPDGVVTHWSLVHSAKGELRRDEAAHATRLAAT